MEDGGGSSILVFILLLWIEIMLYGFGCAIQCMNEIEVKKKAEEGNKKALKILKILEKPSRFVDMLQFFVIMIHLMIGFIYIRCLETYFMGHYKIAYQWAFALGFIILVLLLTVVGVLLPKKIASRYTWEFSFFCLPFISVFLLISRPFTIVLDFIASILAKLFGVSASNQEADVTQQEIISMVNEGHEQGVLHESEAQMITNIFEFSDKTAKDIMTHRSNIIGIDAEMPLQEAVDYMLHENNTRYPVYIENIDHIIGILHFKDACRLLEKGKNDTKPIKGVKNLLREVRFIPETRKIDSLFQSMQALNTHMVIVIDEYGQTSGIVAMEDILEEIVGNIFDEYDDDEQYIQARGKDCYEIDGLTPLEELGEELNIDFSKEEFETLNGLMVSHLEHVPCEEENFDMDYDGYNFKILSVENKVIRNVLVTKINNTVVVPKGEE